MSNQNSLNFDQQISKLKNVNNSDTSTVNIQNLLNSSNNSNHNLNNSNHNSLSTNLTKQNVSKYIDDELSILVDDTTNDDKSNDITIIKESNNHNNLNLSNLITHPKKPNDILDAACLAITEDNPNLFNENFSIEITQSESDLNCELNDYVTNNILEQHNLILEDTNDKIVNDNELIENYLLNVNENKYSLSNDKTTMINKFNLTTQPETINLTANTSENIANLLNSGNLNTISFNNNNDDLSYATTKKKTNLNTSNVHLSYLLQAKPQDLPKHNRKSNDDNFIFGYNCYDNSMSTGNTMQAWSGPNTGQTAWSSNHVNMNNSMLHNSSTMLTNNHQMPPHHLQQSHPHHNQNSNMGVMQQQHSSIMNQKQQLSAYPNPSSTQQQLNPNNINSIGNNMINSGNNLQQTPQSQQSQFINNGQTNGQPPINRSMYSNNNLPITNNMQMISNQSSMHNGQPNCQSIMDTPNQQLTNQGMMYNQQQPVNQQMMPNQNQMVINNMNNNHLMMKQQQQSNYTNQMMPNPPTQQQPTSVTVNSTAAATSKNGFGKKSRKRTSKAAAANAPVNGSKISANISDNYKYAPQQQQSVSMQPNMINNAQAINQQTHSNSMAYYNNSNMPNRMQGPNNQQMYGHHNNQTSTNHQMNSYQTNNINGNGNYGGSMRMQDSSNTVHHPHQIPNSNNGSMMVNGSMMTADNNNLPIQQSAMMNSNKPMISSSINSNSYVSNNMPNNTPIQQPYNNQIHHNSMSNGPITNISRGAPVRNSPYPNPSQHMTQKRAFNTQQQQQQQQQQPNVYINSQNQIPPNNNGNIPPQIQQQQIINNSNSNYINNNNPTSLYNNGPIPNQSVQYQQHQPSQHQSHPSHQQSTPSQMNSHHPNSMHFNKQATNQPNSMNPAYMPSNNNNSMASNAQYPNNNNGTMMNNLNSVNHNNSMINNMQPRNTMRSNNQISNNGNSSYPTPPHSNYQNNSNNYSNYDNNSSQNMNHSSNSMYNNSNFSSHQIPHQSHQHQQLPLQQQQQQQPQQQVCNQTTNNISNATNNSNLINRGYNQQSPIPGNPTPPLTPYPSAGSVGSISNNNSNNSTNSQTSLQMNQQTDIKPQQNSNNNNNLNKEKSRFVLHVKGGMVLEPFILNELGTMNKEFELKPSLHNNLMNKQDYELQFRSFLKEESMITNWPSNVQIIVNNVPMQIEQNKPLCLKKICRPGKNTLQITVNQCSCQHLFTMQVVNYHSVKSIIQDVMRKQLTSVDYCVTKIKQNFNNINYNSINNNSNSNNSSSLQLTPSTPGSIDENMGLEQTSLKLSLKCPITFKRINIPARGVDCKHLQCFDLETFLTLNTDKSSWNCPICKRTIVLENLEVDQYIHKILVENNLHNDLDEIIIDANACWKPSNSNNSNNNINKIILKDEQELIAYQSVNNTNNNQFNSTGLTKSNYSIAPNCGLTNNNTNNQIDNGLMRNSPLGYQSPVNQQQSNNQMNELDPLAAIEKTVNQHDFGSIGRCTPSSNNLMSNQTSAALQQTINKSPICSNTNQTTPSMNNSNPHSTANTPNSVYMINNSPHTPHTPNTPHTPLINHNNSSMNNLGPSSVVSNHSTNNSNINDLNFDPAAVIDGEAGQESLNLLADDIDLLSYLEPDNTDTATNDTTSQLTDDNLYDLFN